jgi:hypothetical protein
VPNSKDNEQQLIRAVFRQAHGQELLDLWRQRYVEQAVYRRGRNEVMEDVAYREAERQFVKRIEDMLNNE